MPSRGRHRCSRLLRPLVVLGLLLAPVALAADQDGDGLEDDWELEYFGDLSEGAQDDADRDGLSNSEEQSLGTDPTLVDTDGDLLEDSIEVAEGCDPLDPDSDDDGLSDYAEVGLHGTDPLVTDTDGGGIEDGDEVALDWTDPLDPWDDALDQDGDGLSWYREEHLGTSDLVLDSDGDGLDDAVEDADLDGVWDGDIDGDGVYDVLDGDETEPALYDMDGDGLGDGEEILTHGTQPFDADTDDDGLDDGVELTMAVSRHTCLDPVEPDSDFDGLDDGTEVGGVADPCLADTDSDGIWDAAEVDDGTDPNDASDSETDSDGDGLSDAWEDAAGLDSADLDSDDDGIDDGQEVYGLDDHFWTDPLDTDTDDDGLMDGSEGGVGRTGTTPQNGTSPVEADTDGDGLLDGVERGLAAPEDPDGTDLSVFIADADPTTTTNPRRRDSDLDRLRDDLEDVDLDGAVDPGETDPSNPDTDGDGVDDYWEHIWSNPAYCDPGITPMNPLDPTDAAADLDGDGLTCLEELDIEAVSGVAYFKEYTFPCRFDTDEDGLADGVEVWSAYANGGVDPTVRDTDGDGLPDGVEDADRDGEVDAGETDPTVRDTDGDGLGDGTEDSDHDGEVDEGESDPLLPDTDGDGLEDGEEVHSLGTDPSLADTDGDGLEDGLEVGLVGDADPDTTTDPLRADTDRDGLVDGAEDYDADGAVGATEADPNLADTDGDGLEDGAEDLSGDGVLELREGETDPTRADTDGGGASDGQEVLTDGTDPVDPRDDRGADADADGLLNEVEWGLGTDPWDADTDADGVADAVELADAAGLLDLDHPVDTDGDGVIDALDRDSDGDSLLDRDEAGGPQPVDTDGDGTPDYRDLDSDDGGVSDRLEVLRDHTDPLDPSDDMTGLMEGPLAGGGCDTTPRRALGWAGLVVVLLLLTRRRGPWLALALALASPALAQEPAETAAVEANTYHIHPSGLGVGSLGSGAVLHHLETRWTLAGHHVSQPVAVRDADGTLLRPVVSRVEGAELAGAMGLGSRWELGFSLPCTVDQVATLPGRGLGSTASAGLGDLVVHGRAQLTRGGLDLALGFSASLPTGDDQAWMGAGRLGLLPSLTASRRLGPVLAVAMVGGEVQQTKVVGNTPDGTHLRFGAGASWATEAAWHSFVEVHGQSRLASRSETAVEVVLGGTWYGPAGFSLKMGLGSGVVGGLTAPTWRGFLALGWGARLAPDRPEPEAVVEPVDGPAEVSEVHPGEDADRDGVSDAEDLCPQELEDLDGFQDDDGCPDPDNDQDGFLDAEDGCPMTPEDVDSYLDTDGCPDFDDDEDGIYDALDPCPFDAEDMDGVEDEDGCPEDDSLATLEADQISTFRPVHFQRGGADLRPESEPVLEEVLAILRANPNLKIRIDGHADKTGPTRSNLALSMARAQAVKTWLTSREPELAYRMQCQGYGAARPLRPGDSEEARANNRRVEFTIVSR